MRYADYVTVGALLVVALAALSIETQLRAIRRLIEDRMIRDGRPARRDTDAEPPVAPHAPGPTA